MIKCRECWCVSVSCTLASECHWIEGYKNADGIGITISVSITEWNNVHASWQLMGGGGNGIHGQFTHPNQVDSTPWAASVTVISSKWHFRKGNFVKRKTEKFIKWLNQSLAHHSAPYIVKRESSIYIRVFNYKPVN